MSGPWPPRCDVCRHYKPVAGEAFGTCLRTFTRRKLEMVVHSWDGETVEASYPMVPQSLALAIAATNADIVAYLDVRPHFGCVQFEAK